MIGWSSLSCILCCLLLCSFSVMIGYMLLKNNTLYVQQSFIPGHAIVGEENLPSVSQEDCENKCKSNKSCQWFEYNAIGNQCSLKASDPISEETKPINSVMGFKLANGLYSTYGSTYLPEGANPNIVPPTNATSESECQTKCTANSECYMYKYLPGLASEECYLKKYMPNQLITSGQVDVRQKH